MKPPGSSGAAPNTPAKTLYYLSDALGSALALQAADGRISARYRYDEFGEHYEKHVLIQKEFGPITKEAYLRGAQKLYSEIADGTNILTKTRLSDKATLIYKPSTNEFLAVSGDGYIKTYFKPKDGIKYWESLN